MGHDMSMHESPEHQLADYAFFESARTPDADVTHHAKRVLMDWHAAVISGCLGPHAVRLEQALADELDRGASRLVSGRRATPRAAALINAVASHTQEVDDIFRDAIYHPGSPIISAVLSAAQARGRSGLDVLRGVVAGYEVSTRIGAAIAREHCRFWHATGTVGTMGAAVGAAVTLGLSREQIRHALATSVTFASGLQQAFRHSSMTKPLHAGHAADVGVMTALAAEQGIEGAARMLDGEAGFGKAMGGDPDWSKAFSSLGSTYNIGSITFKSHCCCGHIFPAVDAALVLRDAVLPRLHEIESIHVHTYRVALNVVGSTQARDASEARFSLPYMLAHALQHGRVSLDSVAPSALSDPATRALMERVVLHLSPELDARFPGQRSCRLEIRFRDGETLAYLQEGRVGDPEIPLSDERLTEKYRGLAVPVIGAQRAEALLRLIQDLEHLRPEQLQRLPGDARDE